MFMNLCTSVATSLSVLNSTVDLTSSPFLLLQLTICPDIYCGCVIIYFISCCRCLPHCPQSALQPHQVIWQRQILGAHRVTSTSDMRAFTDSTLHSRYLGHTCVSDQFRSVWHQLDGQRITLLWYSARSVSDISFKCISYTLLWLPCLRIRILSSCHSTLYCNT
jgi:hypothetical protein